MLILIQSIAEKAAAEEWKLNYLSVDDVKRKYVFESKNGGLNRSYLFGYEQDNPSYEYLKREIFMEDSDIHLPLESTIYTKNLANAKKYFSERVSGLKIEDLQELYLKVTQHCRFNVYIIGRDIDVFVAFETMNNRGKPLTQLELLKNRLIFLSYRLKLEEAEVSKLRANINEAWKTVYHFLGKNERRPLHDDGFLRNQFALYYLKGEYSEAECQAVFNKCMYDKRDGTDGYLLEEYFIVHNLVGRKTVGPTQKQEIKAPIIDKLFLRDYVKHIKTTAELYYNINNPHDTKYPADVRTWLDRMRRLGWRDSMQIVLAAVEAKVKCSDLCSLLEALERYIFVVGIHQAYGYSIDFSQAINKLLSNKGTIPLFIKEFNEELERFLKRVESRGVTFAWGHDGGFYGWRILNYFLYEYEDSLRLKAKSPVTKLEWDDYYQEQYMMEFATIEHIYPQKPDSSEWPSFEKLKPKQKEQIRNSLGNLLAVSRPRNSTFSNHSFAQKRDGVGSEGSVSYKTGSYSEIDIAKCPDWNIQCIADRGVKLLEFMEKRWKVRLGDRKAKLATLRLDWMH
jgi:hypothetical protein